MAHARNYPGQEQAVMEHFHGSPEAMEQVKGPILEDKVVDFICELAKLTDKKVTPEELLKAPEETKPAKKAKSQAKAKAKKASSGTKAKAKPKAKAKK